MRWPYLVVFGVIALFAIAACSTSPEGQHELQGQLSDLGKWGAEGATALAVLLVPSIILTVLLNLHH
jgi:hypothetical protein